MNTNEQIKSLLQEVEDLQMQCKELEQKKYLLLNTITTKLLHVQKLSEENK